MLTTVTELTLHSASFQFYGSMCFVYVFYGIAWMVLIACNWRDILRIQFWIGGVIFLGKKGSPLFFVSFKCIVFYFFLWEYIMSFLQVCSKRQYFLRNMNQSTPRAFQVQHYNFWSVLRLLMYCNLFEIRYSKLFTGITTPRHRTGAIMCNYRFFYNKIPCFLSSSVVLFVTFQLLNHMIQKQMFSIGESKYFCNSYREVEKHYIFASYIT